MLENNPLFEKIKKPFKKSYKNLNQQAKQSQIILGVILMALIATGFGVFVYVKDKHKLAQVVSVKDFDGILDKKFNSTTDEALIEKQDKRLELLSKATQNQSKSLQNEQKKNDQSRDELSSLIINLESKVKNLERENLSSQNKIAGLLQQNDVTRPPSREEQVQMLQKTKFYQQAPLKHMHLPKPPKKKRRKNNRNYIWASTSVEGILTTGILGDAGINGSKNKGSGVIRFIDNGIMPSKQHSFLKDCTVTYSSYGDLSSDTAVLHLGRLSCAGSIMNFEKEVYGSVYDTDAMQDLRGTSVLKSQQILSYSAAAGLLGGIGDGLKNAGSVSAFNTNGTISSFSSTSLAQQAAGGALSNPANKISDYIMKIADIYHPVVVVKPGRKVTVIFLKGFWTDDEDIKEVEEKQGTNARRSNSNSNSNASAQVQDKASLDALLKSSAQSNQPLFKGV